MQKIASSAIERSHLNMPFPLAGSYSTILNASFDTPSSPKKERKWEYIISFASGGLGGLLSKASEKEMYLRLNLLEGFNSSTPLYFFRTDAVEKLAEL